MMSNDDRLICSARGCADDAELAIIWNNPKIHTPDRRKTWLACQTHEPTLRSFLSARGFYLDTNPIEQA